jgi:coproporphyrinogen III oxidase-like Fe-S oxidoreductase
MEIARYEAAGGVLPQERLDWLKGDGLIEEVEGCLRATRDGRLLLNAIVAELAG